jgi:hypothetical protein
MLQRHHGRFAKLATTTGRAAEHVPGPRVARVRVTAIVTDWQPRCSSQCCTASAAACAGSTKTPLCTMPRFLRTMSALLLRGLRPQVTGTPRRSRGLDLVRSWPPRAPWSALSRRQWMTPLAAKCLVFMGYCGVHSAEFGPFRAGDLGRSGAAAPTAPASWCPGPRCAWRPGGNLPCMCR